MSFFLIAGPCVIESKENAFEIANELKRITDQYHIDFYFKASFDKANRTSIDSYRGPGLEKGLQILKDIKDKLNVKICTDIHETWQAAPTAQVADIIQIPAFLCRQTDLLIAAAKTGKIINIKKGQFLAPWDMGNVIQKVKESGNDQIMISERGSSFGYNNLVVDMTSMLEMKKFGVPIVFDATHSVQKPGGNGKSTSGNREYAKALAKAAIAIGVDGIFIETHPTPELALSDAANSIQLSDMEKLLKQLISIQNALEE